MLSTIIMLIRLKKLLDSPLFKFITSTSGALVGKKKSGIVKYAFQFIAMMLVPVLLIAFIVPDGSKSAEDKKKTTYMTPEQYEQYAEANGTAAYWQSQAGNATGNLGDQEYAGEINVDYVLDHDVSKLTDTDITRLKEYVTICQQMADKHGIPVQLIYAVNALEMNVVNLSGSGIYVGKSNFDNGGLGYGKVHPTTGKVINYINYGKTEAFADGTQGTNGYRGPFQLDKDLSIDVYNFPIAADNAAGVLLDTNGKQGSLLSARKYFEGVDIPEELIGSVAITMHNTGTAGFYTRVPKSGTDTRKTFVERMNQISNSAKGTEAIKAMLSAWGSESQYKAMYEACNIDGIALSPTIESAYGITAKATFDFSSVSSNPGDIDGNYKGTSGGYTGDAYKLQLYNQENIVGAVDGKEFGFAFDRESLRYIIGAYSIGKYMEATMNSALKELGVGSSGGGSGSKVQYVWESPIIQLNLPDAKPQALVGAIGEVGYKGNFPIFIQSSGVNDISNLRWKFGGKNTTLGQSGCSMFALMSLIHGSGYGNTPLPSITNGTNGLDAKGNICFEEMTKALPDGPVVADDVSSLGYIVKTIPTDEQGLEVLYNHLTTGIPFVVNVRYGDITGYDANYNPHTVHFTNEGHFILMVGAFELNNKRYVEVVQSTYSNAGTDKFDQNRLVFDFDELIEKQIIRSSSGSAVPAYTILGMQGSEDLPVYLQASYSPPIRVTKNIASTVYVGNPTTQTKVSINGLKSRIEDEEHILLPTELYVNVGKDYVDIFISETTSLRVKNIVISKGITESKKYASGTYIGKITEDTVYERYEMGQNVKLK